MRFTAARIANHHNILSVMNKLAACQFLQEQRRDRVIELGTIKFFQGLQVIVSTLGIGTQTLRRI